MLFSDFVAFSRKFKLFKLLILNTKAIGTKLYNLSNWLFDSFGKISRLIIKKLPRLAKSEYFGFWGTLFLVFTLLMFFGSSGDGQSTLFSNFIEKYIEETSLSVASYTRSSANISEISAIAATNPVFESNTNPGQGGPDITAMTPSPINDNSLLAYNPVSTDYIETSGFKRNQVTEYTVQSGDLLSFIASDYGVSINSIIWANKLRDADSISPGQILKIPPVSGVIHNIVKGDTVASIAKKYGTEEAKIIEFNDLPQSGELQIGDELMVPDGQIRSTYAGSTGTSKRFGYLPNLGNYFMQPSAGYNWGRIHGRNGVDVANSCGTPIYAAADGSVAIADGTGWNGGFGKFVKLVHSNGTETLYAHATKLLIGQGEYAQRGQMIALIGSTGRSTGCHLHFEVHGARNPLAKY